MKRNGIITCCIILFWIVSAFIAWLGGYDFNRRGEDVAIYALCVIVFSLPVAGIVSNILDLERYK